MNVLKGVKKKARRREALKRGLAKRSIKRRSYTITSWGPKNERQGKKKEVDKKLKGGLRP